jgi:flagellar hook protein FlgE
MSITGSLYIAESSLNALDIAMNVTGHNIANVNTVGFKASEAEFADLFGAAQEQLQTGQGTLVAGVARSETQGATEVTGNTLDLAVAGAGFFVLKDASGNSFYSRAGEFTLGSGGNVVNPGGLALQGAAGNIVIPSGLTLPAQPTTTASLAVNLDGAAATPASAFPAGPDAAPGAWFSAGNFSAVLPLYDDFSGVEHDSTILFRKSGANSWDYRVVAPRNEIDPLAPTSTELREIGSGTLTFDAAGVLTGFTGAVNAVTWISGGASQAALDFTGATQFAGPSAVLKLTQDGAALGTLSRLTIDQRGNITGEFSNGRAQTLGQVLLANFRNSDGLEAAGDSLLAATQDSGAAVTGAPGQGGLGVLLSGALEQSNVDLAQEFVSMILTQRGFQMNSRVITVADQMYSIAAGLKP